MILLGLSSKVNANCDVRNLTPWRHWPSTAELRWPSWPVLLAVLGHVVSFFVYITNHVFACMWLSIVSAALYIPYTAIRSNFYSLRPELESWLGQSWTCEMDRPANVVFISKLIFISVFVYMLNWYITQLWTFSWWSMIDIWKIKDTCHLFKDKSLKL